MGTLNNGSQVLQFNYKAEGISKGFNILNHKLHSRGIYSGGTFARVSDTAITLSPTLLFFEEPLKQVGIRIETTVNATINVLPTTPYIVGRYTWINTENNYMDFLAVASYNLEDTDIIFGRLVFNGSVLTTEYDYSKKQWSYNYYNNVNDELPPFKVEAQEPYSNTVIVGPGRVFFDSAIVTLAINTNSPAFSLPVSANGRTDLITLNRSSAITIIQGVDTSGAPIPTLTSDYLLLAIVRFPANATQVSGSYIEYIPPNKYLDGGISSRAISGDSSKGAIVITNANSPIKSGFYTLNSPYTNGPTTTAYHIIHCEWNDGTQSYQTAFNYNTNDTYIRRRNTSTWAAWQKVWNAGNDGTGSGLDADMIDGIESSRIVYGNSSQKSNDIPNADLAIASGFYILTDPFTNGPTAAYYYIITCASTGVGGALQIACTAGASSTYFRRLTSGVWQSWVKLWNADNDGVGSGLDADMVDGIESSRIVYGDLGTACNVVADANLIDKTGFYQIVGATGNHVPVDAENYWCINHIQAIGSGYVTQLAIRANGSPVASYIRTQIGTTWGSWIKLWTAANDGAASGLETDLVPTATPASATAAGTAGMIRYDASYVYICTATNTWRRIASSSW
jgi:hypothetical protein